MKVGVEVGGLDVFDRLKNGSGEYALRSALVAGGKIIRDQAQANINGDPKNITGTLKANVILKHVPEESVEEARQTYKVTVRSGKHSPEGDAYYWRWVEEGHGFPVDMSMRPKGTSTREWRRLVQAEYGDSRVPPHPYLRPALDAKFDEALRAIRTRYIEILNEATK